MFQGCVATAARALERACVDDPDPAVTLPDHLTVFKIGERNRHPGPRDAEQLRYDLLRQLNRIGMQTIATREQPSA